jgi:hypothetical protein
MQKMRVTCDAKNESHLWCVVKVSGGFLEVSDQQPQCLDDGLEDGSEVGADLESILWFSFGHNLRTKLKIGLAKLSKMLICLFGAIKSTTLLLCFDGIRHLTFSWTKICQTNFRPNWSFVKPPAPGRFRVRSGPTWTPWRPTRKRATLRTKCPEEQGPDSWHSSYPEIGVSYRVAR